MSTLEQYLLYRTADHGMAIFTLRSSCESQNLGRKRAETPKLEGMTVGFAHVPGRASYASISMMDVRSSAWRHFYLTTFTSRSEGDTLLID